MSVCWCLTPGFYHTGKSSSLAQPVTVGIRGFSLQVTVRGDHTWPNTNEV